MNYSEANDETKRKFIEVIDKRLAQLVELGNHWANRAVQYLFVTSGGSLVAILGYFGSNPTNISGALVIASILFTAAIIGVGLLIIAIYFRILYISTFFRKDIKHFLDSSLSWENLHSKDESRSGFPALEISVGLITFFIFIIGLGFASCGIREVFASKAPIQTSEPVMPASKQSVATKQSIY